MPRPARRRWCRNRTLDCGPFGAGRGLSRASSQGRRSGNPIKWACGAWMYLPRGTWECHGPNGGVSLSIIDVSSAPSSRRLRRGDAGIASGRVTGKVARIHNVPGYQHRVRRAGRGLGATFLLYAVVFHTTPDDSCILTEGLGRAGLSQPHRGGGGWADQSGG